MNHDLCFHIVCRYLYNVLCKNQVVTEQNKSLLVETLRSISEILIWGDQNDSTVFEWVFSESLSLKSYIFYNIIV